MSRRKLEARLMNAISFLHLMLASPHLGIRVTMRDSLWSRDRIAQLHAYGPDRLPASRTVAPSNLGVGLSGRVRCTEPFECPARRPRTQQVLIFVVFPFSSMSPTGCNSNWSPRYRRVESPIRIRQGRDSS